MQSALRRIVGLTIFLVGAILPLLPAGADGEATVSVLPAEGTFVVGAEIEAEVWVEDVVDLYGGDIELSFDASRLEVLDANPSQPGIQIQPLYGFLVPGIIVRNEADNTAGTIRFAATQLYPSPAVSGSGALFAFTFRALDLGLADVGYVKVQLADGNAEPISSSTVGASYRVVESHLVFLPLVAAGP